MIKQGQNQNKSGTLTSLHKNGLSLAISDIFLISTNGNVIFSLLHLYLFKNRLRLNFSMIGTRIICDEIMKNHRPGTEEYHQTDNSTTNRLIYRQWNRKITISLLL